MSQIRRIIGIAIALLGMAAAPASADHQTGDVTLNVQKTLSSTSVTGSGINCGSDCTETYTLGEDCTFVGDGGNHNDGRVQCDTVYPNVTLTPNTPSGIVFEGWNGGGCTGNGTCRPALTEGSTVVTATFADGRAPSFTVDAPVEGRIYNGTIGFTATASDADVVDQVSWTVDGVPGGFVDSDDSPPGGTSQYTSGLIDSKTFFPRDGSYTVWTIATDKSRNGAAKSRTITIDNTAPTAEITSTPDGAFLRGEHTIAADATDANGVDSVVFEVTSGRFVDTFGDFSAPFTRELDTTTLPDGPATIRITARDEAFPGNVTTDVIEVTIDNTTPELSITEGPTEGSTISERSPLIRFAGTDSATDLEYYCRWDDKTANHCPPSSTSSAGGSFAVGPLADGQHTVHITAIDRAGNSASVSRTFTVDGPDDQPPPDDGDPPPDDGDPPPEDGDPPPEDGKPPEDGDPPADRVAPETTIVKGPKRKSAKRKATFTLGASEPGVRFECQLDRKPWAPCASPFKVKVKRGKHTLAVRSTDAAGNTDVTPATARWRVRR